LRVLNCKGEKYFNPYLARSADDKKIKARIALSKWKTISTITILLTGKEEFHKTITDSISFHIRIIAAPNTVMMDSQISSLTSRVNLRKSAMAYQQISILRKVNAVKIMSNGARNDVNDSEGLKRLTKQKTKAIKKIPSNIFRYVLSLFSFCVSILQLR